MVSRGVLSSRRLLSHYIPALLLSFVETPACICVPAYTFIRATHFSHFIPLSFRPRRSLVNMIFLNSYLLARASVHFVIYHYSSYFVESHSPVSHLSLWCRAISFSLATIFISFLLFPLRFPRPLSRSVSFPFCVNLILILAFLFFFPLLFAARSVPFCFTALLHRVSPWPVLHYHFLVSFFHFVFSRTVLIVPSQLPQSPRYTPQLARRDGFSFPACHTCIRWA